MWAYVVHESNTLDVQVLPVKRVLKKSDDVFVDGVLGGEPFGPCEEIPLVECGLFDRE